MQTFFKALWNLYFSKLEVSATPKGCTCTNDTATHLCSLFEKDLLIDLWLVSAVPVHLLYPIGHNSLLFPASLQDAQYSARIAGVARSRPPACPPFYLVFHTHFTCFKNCVRVLTLQCCTWNKLVRVVLPDLNWRLKCFQRKLSFLLYINRWQSIILLQIMCAFVLDLNVMELHLKWKYTESGLVKLSWVGWRRFWDWWI